MKQVFYYLTCVFIRPDSYSVEANQSPIVRACILYQIFERSIHHMLITMRTISRVLLQISSCVKFWHDVPHLRKCLIHCGLCYPRKLTLKLTLPHLGVSCGTESGHIGGDATTLRPPLGTTRKWDRCGKAASSACKSLASSSSVIDPVAVVGTNAEAGGFR
jgi:hypothetical protein